MNDAKVSVIIPIYNVEKYLGDCLNSVTNQTLREIEIICVNDCSTDNSGIIAKSFAEKDQRIILLENDRNMGLSETRNRGLKIASGRYVYFLDSDDFILLDALEKLYALAEKDKLDLILFDSKMIFENESLKNEMKRDDLFAAKSKYPEILTGKEYFFASRNNDDMREPVWIQFVKRKVLEDKSIRFFKGLLHEDILYSFLLMMNAQRVRCINEQYHFYRRRENAITTVRGNEKNLASLAKTYVEIFIYWKEHQLGKRYDEAIEHYLDRISWKVNRYLDDQDDREKVKALLEDDPVSYHMFKLILEDPKPQSPRYR